MADTAVSARRALRELDASFERIDPNAAGDLAGEMLSARRIVCYGLGREGLMIRAFCMRLVHLGLDAHVAGDVTAPPVGPGDVLLVSSGPGDLLMVNSMIRLGHKACARVVALTAQPDGPDPRAANRMFVITAQTMASDRGSSSVLPMGTAFEIAMLIFLDLVAIRIGELSGQTMDQLRARHSNLE